SIFQADTGDREHNRLRYGKSSGGGIYAESSTLNVINSEISGNEARYGGGIDAAGYRYDAVDRDKLPTQVTITNSTISGNQARSRETLPYLEYDSHGGGIAASGDTDVTITYSTITENSVDQTDVDGNLSTGGGIYFPDANLGDPLPGRTYDEGGVLKIYNSL